MYMYVPYNICQQICKKGSYMWTTSINTQISPLLINEQTIHVCLIANSSFPEAAFRGHVRCPQVLGLSLIGFSGC